MTRRPTFWLLALLAAAGCRGRADLIEAELRVKDRQLRCLHDENQRLTGLTEAFATTLSGQRPPCAPGGAVNSSVRDIQVGRGTGGIDEDKCQGDEGILVVIVPRDGDGSAIKADGAARVNALQITPEGLKVPLSTWEVTPGNLRRNWKTGLLSTGYFVSLPWQAVPMSERLRVVVQFQTPDGAVFEAERDVQVRLPHGPSSGPLPGPPALPPPAPFLPEGTLLPPPTPVTSQKVPAGLLPPEPRPTVIVGTPE